MLSALIWLVAASVTVSPTKFPNGTTLPFQRHVVRVGPSTTGAGTLVAALQKQGSDGDGLTLYTSSDQGARWTRTSQVPVDQNVRFTADLLADDDGKGFLLVYGVEPHSSLWTVDARFHVGLFHYALKADGSVAPDRGPVTIFSSASTRGWFRPSVTRDAQGTLHVTATRMDGSGFSFHESRSIDGGVEWTPAEELAHSGSSFIGGRVTAFGSKVAVVYDEYRYDAVARFRVAASGACATWEPEETFAPDGLYHAGAFATVATPDGRLHLAYHAKRGETLRHRVFDSLSWSAPFTFEPVGGWANQPGISRRGNDVIVAWNQMKTDTDMRMRARTRRADGSWGTERVVDDSSGFKWYTNALESVTPGESALVLWCEEVPGGAVVRASAIAP